MNATTIDTLIQLNREFYQTFAQQFSATRMRLQPGVAKLLKSLPLNSRVLELGCGNGELAYQLGLGDFTGTYVGLDNSESLISIARQRFEGDFSALFFHAELSISSWDSDLRLISDQNLRPPYDVIFAFAVLHHIPGLATRQQLLRKIHSLLSPHGQFIHSEWQFLNSPRLRQRIQPWEAIGLKSSDVALDDYLLDWRQGGYGLRYVHHFSLAELSELASATGFEILETFQSDGEGGNLGLYQIWNHA